MDVSLNVVAFLIGMNTAYYIMAAYLFLWSYRNVVTRLHRVLAGIFIYLALANTKDLFFTFSGQYVDSVLSSIMLVDGWSGIGYAALLFEITQPGWIRWRRIALLSIPFAVFTVAYFFVPRHGFIEAYALFLCIFGLVIMLVGYRKARKYTAYIHANYSNIDKMDIGWVRHMFILCFFGQLLWLVASLAGNLWIDCAYYIAAVALWHMMCEYIRNLRSVEIETPDGDEEDSCCEDASSEKCYAFAGDVDAVMERERLWLNPNLSLNDLARKLSTNRTYLSNYFSNVRKTTFYDYVNGFRIEKEGVPLVLKHREYTLDYIAQLSGFNSLSTFRRAFIKVTGYTPCQFRDGIAGESK